MAKDLASRYSRAEDMANDLRAFQRTFETPSPVPKRIHAVAGLDRWGSGSARSKSPRFLFKEKLRKSIAVLPERRSRNPSRIRNSPMDVLTIC